MESSTTDSNLDLTQFWEEIPQSKMMKQRLKSLILQDVKSVLRQTTNKDDTQATGDDLRNIHATLLQVTASSSRLERKLDHCLWTQKVFIVLVMGLTALWAFTLYIHCSAGYSSWATAKN